MWRLARDLAMHQSENIRSSLVTAYHQWRTSDESLTALNFPLTFVFLPSSSLGNEDSQGFILFWEDTCCRLLFCSLLLDGHSRICVKTLSLYPP